MEIRNPLIYEGQDGLLIFSPILGLGMPVRAPWGKPERLVPHEEPPRNYTSHVAEALSEGIVRMRALTEQWRRQDRIWLEAGGKGSRLG